MSRSVFGSLVLALTACLSACGSMSMEPANGGTCSAGALATRTDLFFGFSRVHVMQPPVSQTEWQNFLDTVVTPLFQEGLTMFNPGGQFQQMAGSTKDDSRIIIVLHDGSAVKSGAIESIRDTYKRQFTQEAVLRIDDRVCASF